MSERDTLLLLGDIRDSIIHILEFTKGMTLEMYESDLKTRFAVERNFEIIGEAASRISENYKLCHPEIEWRILKDFRNFIIHEYFGINNEIVWDTI
ncbi:MAG TPA: HepT-like ribonuclease domain-containing protein [Hanamia sp.]|nr:HepT-like ribonuclease domain-containing protein [Hanamia sp.]